MHRYRPVLRTYTGSRILEVGQIEFANGSGMLNAPAAAVLGLCLERRRFLAAVFIAPLAGCRKPVSEPAPIRVYSLRGEVVRLDSARRIATIKHEKIDGWMEAMTMDFPVREDRDLAALSPQRAVTAKVYVQDLEFWIGDVQARR